MSKEPKKTFTTKFIGIGLIAAVVIGVLGYAAYNVFKQEDQASASFSTTDCVTLKMQPGATCGFRIDYSNGEGSPTTNSVLNIFIGSELVVDQSSFTDQLSINGVTGNTFPINYSAINQTVTNGWGAKLLYFPGSANTAGTPSGTSTPGNLAASTTGSISFRATLKPDVISSGRYKAGDILQPPSFIDFTTQQGVLSVLNTAETPTPVQGTVKITILAPDPVSSTSSSSSVAVSSSSSSVGTYQSGTLTGTIGGPAGGTITLANNTYTGPAIFKNANSCDINGNITNSVFVINSGEIVDLACQTGNITTGQLVTPGSLVSNVPSNFTPAASSSSSVAVSSSSSSVVTSSSSSSSQVAIDNCDNKFGNNCRLYFVGANNTAVNWDAARQTNIGWDKTQKFKDGTVKIVFDNIKKSNGSQIANGSPCGFDMVRYGNTDVLKTFSGSVTASGKSEASFVVNDQTVNYYTVTVTCNETGTNEVIKDYDRLVLIVGAQGNRTGPEISL